MVPVPQVRLRSIPADDVKTARTWGPIFSSLRIYFGKGPIIGFRKTRKAALISHLVHIQVVLRWSLRTFT